VVVDGALYVRAYNGHKSQWYQAACAEGGPNQRGGHHKDVSFEPVEGVILVTHRQRLQAKYKSSEYLGAMIGTRARAATVNIVPRASKN